MEIDSLTLEELIKAEVDKKKIADQRLGMAIQNKGKSKSEKDKTELDNVVKKDQIKRKHTKYNNHRIQTVLSGNDESNKKCVVPYKRNQSIDKLTSSNQRTYQNDFTEYFLESNSSDMESFGKLSTNSQVTRNLIEKAVENILTKDMESEGNIDAEQKKVLQELYIRDKQEKEFKCKNCPESFNNICGLQRHFKIEHHKRLSTKCMLCKIVFETPSLHKDHRKSVHTKIREDVKCKFCEKVFCNTPAYDKHKQGMHEGIVTKCKVCDKTFSFRENMLRHLRQVHTDLKPFGCKQCKRYFGDSSNLQRHVRSLHLKIRVPCQICKRSCRDLGDLSRHITEKHGKPLMCQVCKIDFLSLYGLNIHLNKVHSKTPQEYPCSKCSLTFLAPQDRWVHKNNAHTKPNEQLYRCKYCHEHFETIAARKKHVLTHLPEISPRFSCKCGVTRLTQIRLDQHKEECRKT